MQRWMTHRWMMDCLLKHVLSTLDPLRGKCESKKKRKKVNQKLMNIKLPVSVDLIFSVLRPSWSNQRTGTTLRNKFQMYGFKFRFRGAQSE